MPGSTGNKEVHLIGLDARLYAGNYTGIGIYTRNLIDGIAAADTKNSYILYSDRPLEAPGPNFRACEIPFSKRIVWSQLILPFSARSHHLDLFHATANHEMPMMINCPSVVTVHDLIPVLFPKTVPPRHRLIFRTFIGPAIRRAKKVITDSEFVKKSLISRFGLPAAKLMTIPLAHDPVFSAPVTPVAIENVRHRYGLKEKYVLYVGAMEPRKNIPALISAFAAISAQKMDWQLVIAGGGGWYKEKTMTAARASGLGERLVFTGFVDPGDLPSLYQGASIFVYPSIYEGFGLPVLEAMASGTPVLVSSPSALEEIAGDAGMTFNVDDADDLGRKLSMLMQDEDERVRMSGSGIRRAALYSWKRCARETLAVYETVLEGEGAR